MRRFLLIFVSGLLFYGSSIAERGDAMMAWPYLVQLDFNEFHGKMVKTCIEKYPETASAFKAAIAKWSKENSPAILELRKMLRVRFMALNGVSDADASKEIERRGRAVTAMYTEAISSSKDASWGPSCNGQYAAETLQQMDFVSFLSDMTPVIVRLRPEEIFPTP